MVLKCQVGAKIGKVTSRWVSERRSTSRWQLRGDPARTQRSSAGMASRPAGYIYISKWQSPIPRGALKKRKCEGTLRAGLLQGGLQSFLQRVLPPNETPSQQETLRMAPKMSQNTPKRGP